MIIWVWGSIDFPKNVAAVYIYLFLFELIIDIFNILDMSISSVHT